MASKGFFEAFREGWTEGSKPRRRAASVITSLPRRVVALKSEKPEVPYQWIRVARYMGEDTSLEPKASAGFWRWLLKRIKQG
jgi:hypothetical protein